MQGVPIRKPVRRGPGAGGGYQQVGKGGWLEARANGLVVASRRGLVLMGWEWQGAGANLFKGLGEKRLDAHFPLVGSGD